jgi:hypothetical protein
MSTSSATALKVADRKLQAERTQPEFGNETDRKMAKCIALTTSRTVANIPVLRTMPTLIDIVRIESTIFQDAF